MKTKSILASVTFAVLLMPVLQPSTVCAKTVVTNTAVAAGASHSLFLRADGSVWGMGTNDYGQLGIGSGISAMTVPVQILSNGVAAVAAGGFHSVLRIGRDLWGMGYNRYGQLGDGTTNDHFIPEKIFSGSISLSASVMAGGAVHSLFGTYSAISPSSTGLRVMGANGLGELGDGTDIARYSPEQVESGTAISAVAAGYGHSLYVRSDGSLWGMGDNSWGQLGLGFIQATNIQTQIVSSGVTAVAAGFDHTLCIKSGGSLWVMGKNQGGQLGDGRPGAEEFVTYPEQIAPSGVVAVAAGVDHSLFITSDGRLWGMGLSIYGQLGLGTNSYSNVPIPIASNVVAVAAGEYHTLFIKSDGTLWGMGDNTYGQLGLGAAGPHIYTPTQIAGTGVSARMVPPTITGISLSGANLTLNGANGATDEIITTLVGTNATQALSSWQPVATNTLSADGNFTITATNAVDPTASQRYYILKAQ